MRSAPFVINVGLPRTGTTSFSRAVELLGFQSLHIWENAEFNPIVIDRLKANDGELRQFLSGYDALSDTPFYALREIFELYYPDTMLIYTTRPKTEWIKSMLNHRMAGGDYLVKRYGLRGVPYKKEDQDDLSRLYDQHHEQVCWDLPSIDLGDLNDQSKWQLLCSAFPHHEALFLRTKNMKWPHENGK